MIPQIKIEDYNYPLDDSRIAKYPLAERDASKLLHYKDAQVKEYSFRDLPSLLPEGAIMVFNETKVVPARMFFQRDTGAHIEIFCLEPVNPPEYNTIFASTECCSWKCVVGNLKKWKNDVLSLINTADDPDIAKLALKASMVRKEGNTAVVEFRWSTGVPFSRVLDMAGNVPIPPYLNRETEAIDLERYQTLYARVRGSVAAPTAGLHFTPRVLDAIGQKGIDINDVCLHVGAGTFLPVKSSNVADHPMHREPFSVGIGLLRKLAEKKAPLIAVGTTSVRTLESLYYAGVDCIENGAPKDIGQWVPYEREYPYSTEESLKALVEYLESNNLEELKLGTRIIIVPGFRFRLVDYLVTNFHQPESTLILLVSAFVKGDWRRIYDFALANGFRFLSYGDSSLLERVE
ncbi:MAG: S-adenosylmethionine:tRNA ribosyltransferase-isomerase [Bacteroidales bacterium]|nr:S-adenosylmethionine:tRNA ribosyltransferase-isomerase [Bacteroidales bacterium]MBQ3984895.1 S-adenosylmethionine:tRNA ribosyltransferase-isomerase [Bacteroidales bacterium]